MFILSEWNLCRILFVAPPQHQPTSKTLASALGLRIPRLIRTSASVDRPEEQRVAESVVVAQITVAGVEVVAARVRVIAARGIFRGDAAVWKVARARRSVDLSQ